MRPEELARPEAVEDDAARRAVASAAITRWVGGQREAGVLGG